jgi:hypothetical protein
MTNNILQDTDVTCDYLTETTTLFFRGRWVRLETVRIGQGDSLHPEIPHAQIRDLDEDRILCTCMHGFWLQHAFVWKDWFYVFGTDYYGIWMIKSFDLHEWSAPEKVFDSEKSDVIHYQNNAIVYNGSEFVMALDLLGGPYFFTICFASSRDLSEWHYIPGAMYKPHFYTSCPHLVWCDGWYHLFHVRNHENGYHTFAARSRDLLVWEDSPHNPLLSPAEDERIMRNRWPGDTDEYRAINRSDLNLFERDGVTYANFHVGDQRGYPPGKGPVVHIRQSYYPGPMKEFLEKLYS